MKAWRDSLLLAARTLTVQDVQPLMATTTTRAAVANCGRIGGQDPRSRKRQEDTVYLTLIKYSN